MTASLVLDLVVAGLLLLSFARGFHRGLILSLCSLLAVVLALAGGWFLADQYGPALQRELEPMLLAQQATQETGQEEAAAPQETPESAPVSEDTEGAQEAPGLFSGLTQSLPFLADGETALSQAQALAAQGTAAALAELLAKGSLFVLGFVVVLAAWKILSHALDLVARLPGLHFLNKAAGGLFGLAKGYLLLTVAGWVLVDLLGVIPAGMAQGSFLLPLFPALPSLLE